MGPASLSMVKLVCFDVFFFNVFVCFLGACFWGLLCLHCLFGWFVELCVVFCVFNLKNIGCLWTFFSVESSLFCCTEAVELFVILLACHGACTFISSLLLFATLFLSAVCFVSFVSMFRGL